MAEKTWDERVAATAAHMDDPQPGDRFEEMYTFWVHVVGRNGDLVAYREHTGKWSRVKFDAVEDFRARYAYGSIPGYSVLYRDAEGHVEEIDWGAEIATAKAAKLAKASLDSAGL